MSACKHNPAVHCMCDDGSNCNQKPEALRLADALANLRRWHELTDDECDEAAAELRRLSAIEDEWARMSQDNGKAEREIARLHEAHDWQHKMAGDRLRRIEKLEALNQELLEALKLALSAHGVLLLSDPPQDAWKTYGVEQKARAAIKKAEGQA